MDNFNIKQTRNLKDKRSVDGLRKRLVNQGKRINSAQLEMGALLYELRESQYKGKPLWTLWGYEGFYEYVEAECRLSARYAQRMLKVHWIFYVLYKRSWDHSLAEDPRLPFSKLNALTRAVDKNNIKRWLKFALENSTVTIERTIEQVKLDNEELERCGGGSSEEMPVEPPKDVEGVYMWTATCRRKQLDRVQQAERLYRRLNPGKTRKGDFLTDLSTDWIKEMRATKKLAS